MAVAVWLDDFVMTEEVSFKLLAEAEKAGLEENIGYFGVSISNYENEGLISKLTKAIDGKYGSFAMRMMQVTDRNPTTKDCTVFYSILNEPKVFDETEGYVNELNEDSKGLLSQRKVEIFSYPQTPHDRIKVAAAARIRLVLTTLGLEYKINVVQAADGDNDLDMDDDFDGLTADSDE